MKKIIFDSNIMTSAHSAGAYRVYYILYYDPSYVHKSSIYIPEDPITEYNTNANSNSACFAGVKNMLQPYVNSGPYCKVVKNNVPLPNRIYYKMDFNTSGKPKLSKMEKYSWLRLCKQYNLLPSYVEPSTTVTGKVVFDLTGIPPSMLYTYLTMMRAIVEYPAFVKAMVYLVGKIKMNFYAAFVYTTVCYISNYGHHIINPSVSYSYRLGSSGIINMSGIEFHLMAGLKRFYDNPREFDKRHMTELCSTYWRCNDTIKLITKIKQSLKVSDLFKPSLEKAIEAKTDGEAKEHLHNLSKEPDTKIILKNLSIKSKIKERVGGK